MTTALTANRHLIGSDNEIQDVQLRQSCESLQCVAIQKMRGRELKISMPNDGQCGARRLHGYAPERKVLPPRVADMRHHQKRASMQGNPQRDG